MHRTTPEFQEWLRKLPANVQQNAKKNIEFLTPPLQFTDLDFQKLTNSGQSAATFLPKHTAES